MRWNAIAAVLLVVTIASLALNAYQYASPRSVTVTTTHTSPSVSTVTTTYTSLSISHSKVFLMEVNGSLYYADDVSEDISVGAPGYSYFLNGSVAFSGVKFETICPPIYAGCPIPSGTTIQNQTIVYAGAIRLNVTFSDGNTETIGGVIGDSTYMFVLSQHAYPRAGILIEYVTYNYPNNFPPYHAFLLVSS